MLARLEISRARVLPSVICRKEPLTTLIPEKNHAFSRKHPRKLQLSALIWIKPMHSAVLNWHSGVFHSLSGETSANHAECLPRRGEISPAAVAPAKIHRAVRGLAANLN